MPKSSLRYEYPEHYVADVWEAIALAEALRESGKYDLFRGQKHTFDITPSAFRAGVDPDEVERSLNSFASWVHQTPDLASLHGNINAITAVAQHYGIKTHFLDFSYSPRIAGFFATDGCEISHTGTIICIQRERFRQSWEELNSKQIASEGIPLADIVEIDVKNLWRMQAQQGAFVRCHVNNIMLEMFSHILHIYFPQKPSIIVEPSEKIYPPEKSQLEVLLEQYFLIASYPERKREAERVWGPVLQVSADGIEDEIASLFVGDKIPDVHLSWETPFANRWLNEPDEKYGRDARAFPLPLTLPTDDYSTELTQAIEKLILEAIDESSKENRGNIDWQMHFPDGTLVFISGEGPTPDQDEWTEFSMSEMLNTIYSGMRYLPYTNRQVARALTRYIIMVVYGPYGVIDDTKGIEFEGGGVRGRGFCSESRLREALRDDFFELLKPEKLDEQQNLGFRDILFAGRFLKTAFVFEKFVELFVEDLIPTQADLAVEGLVIGLNPMRLEILGET